MLEGWKVVTPAVNFGASVQGVFDSRSDRFDPSRHQVTPTVSPGVRLRKAVADRGTVLKAEPAQPKPKPSDYLDTNSDAENDTLTPGGMGQVLGHRLKFEASDANQGLFLIAADGTETQVDVVGRNKPTQLMFMVPADLPAGDYTLEVRAAFGDEVRAGTLDATLTVA